MRAKRAKQYRKLMKQYGLSFNFREPYQVLLDSQMIQDAARFKMHLGQMLENTLSGSIKPMITQCSIRHLYNLPTTTDAEKQQKDGYIEVAKAAERRRCGHHELESPLSTLECLQSVVDPKDSGTNKHRYIVASQDPEVRARMRDIVGVPLVYVNRSVMILEPMARRTEEVRDREERGKLRAGLKGRRGAQIGEKRKRDSEDEDEGRSVQDETADKPTSKVKRTRGPKGPNPLSVKKAKKDTKPVAKQVADERAVIRKAAIRDPQADEKALGAVEAVGGSAVENIDDGMKKRKRKRRPKEDSSGEALNGSAVDMV